MKAGWETRNLEKLCEVFADGDWIESKDQSPSGIRLIQTGNVGNGVFKDRADKARYISEDTFRRLRCTEILEGDCLISRLPDPVGRSCLIPALSEKCITAVDCTIIRFDRSRLMPELFNYYSQSQEYAAAIAGSVGGATRQRISRKNLGLLQIPLPPLDEQRRIVAVLDKAFANIATATANAQKNLTNARALFESYLQSTFNKSGDGWIERRLGEICGLQNGFAFQSNTFQESGVPVLRISNIQNETIEARRLVYINPADYRENLERFKVKKGALLIAMSGATTGKVGILDEDEVYYLNQRVGKFEPTAHLDKHYLFYYLITKVEENLSISAGSAQPNLSTAQIKEFVIPVPPIEQQAKIVEIFSEMRAHCEQLKSNVEQKLAALTELKQSLLQKAFAGELT